MRLVGGPIIISALALVGGACSLVVDTGDLTVMHSSWDASVDDAPSDAAAPDADAGALCDIRAPFATTQIVTPIGMTAGAASPRLSESERIVYFQAAEPGGGTGMFMATRALSQGKFSSPQPLSSLNTTFADGNPFVTADGRTIYFTSDRTGGPGSYDLYVATRPSDEQPFSDVAVVLGASTARGEFEPWVTEDAELWFGRDVPDASGDIHRFTLGGPGATALPVDELNTGADEVYPVVSADGLEVFFGRKVANGNYDIYVAHRQKRDDKLSPPVVVGELQTANDESPGWLSRDRCRLYFERYVGNRSEVFVAERSR